MHSLGIDALDIQNPEVFRKYIEVSSYLGRYEDAGVIVRMVSRNTPLNERLQKVWEYVGLRNTLDSVKKRKAELPPHGTISSESEDTKALRESLTAQEYSLINEIIRYER